MAMDHQKYATENEAAKVQAYAEQRGFEIVRIYADEGKSGFHSVSDLHRLAYARSLAACTCRPG